MSSSAPVVIQPGVPTYIPIRTEEDDDDIPIWAMIEVNGELLEPRNDKDDGDENSGAVVRTRMEENDTMAVVARMDEAKSSRMTIDPESIELGAVHFVDDQVRSDAERNKEMAIFYFSGENRH